MAGKLSRIMAKKRPKKQKKSRSSPGVLADLRGKPLPERSTGLLLDHEQRRLLVFSPDMLINQLCRDGPRIEASFDALCAKELRELSDLQSRTYALLLQGLQHAVGEKLAMHQACGELLTNASNSFGSAVAVLRMGYVLQPGIIIRSLLEAASTVLHLLQRPGDLAAYQTHTLASSKTIGTAKKALPPFGLLYGFFSDNFAHIGHLHKAVTPIRPFTERHEALELNLGFLRMAAWLLYVTTEMLFNHLVPEPRYWKPVEGGMTWDPSPEEKIWMATFFDLGDEQTNAIVPADGARTGSL